MQGVKGRYEGLQVVIKDHRVLEWVTRGYRVNKGLKRITGVTVGYKGLQGVKWFYWG